MPLILGQSLLTQARMTVDAGLLVELKEKSDDIQNLQEEEEKVKNLEFDILSIQYDTEDLDLAHINDSQTALEVKQLCQNYYSERRQTRNSLITAKSLVKDQETVYQRPRRIAEEEILQETIAKCAVTSNLIITEKQAKDEGREENPEEDRKRATTQTGTPRGISQRNIAKIQKKIEKEQQLKQERQEEYRRYLEREEKARVTEKELTRWEMLNRQKQHEVNKGYYVERVGTKEGPRFTSTAVTAVDYMKRWSMPLESDSDSESDIEERDSPRNNSQEITNPGSDPPRPDDAMGFRDEPKVRNSRDVGTDQSRPPPSYVNVSDEKLKQLKEETNKDEHLRKVKEMIMKGWPNDSRKVDSDIKNYNQYRGELTVIDDLIYKGQSIVVPKSMRHEMVQKIHYTHLGINKCLKLAQESIFWPNMCNEIRQVVANCPLCLKYSKSQPKEVLQSHEIPTLPWNKVGCDIMEIMGKKHGIPLTLVSDGGTQFTSLEFKNFAKEWEFNIVITSPTHAQSNGMAERHIQTAKGIFKKVWEDRKDIDIALLHYRNTPIFENISPAQILMSRRLRTVLPTTTDNLKPRITNRYNAEVIKQRQAKQQIYYNGRTIGEYSEILKDTNVFVQTRPKGDIELNEHGMSTQTTADNKNIINNSFSNRLSNDPGNALNTNSASEHEFQNISRSGRIIKKPQKLNL
ncbi:Integrase zinc binding domain [Popillia japonica]|uniref:RNA-directed DNA polymerase n=1 Tax=Popillia japonica TaxID=7064 RepID=A0AAW1IBB0_POPJA